MPTGVYKRTKEILSKLKGRKAWNKGNVKLHSKNCETCNIEFKRKCSRARFCSKKCVRNITTFRKGHRESGAKTNWKGEHASYSAKHHWIKRHRGSPNFCEHCKKSNLRRRQYHWANISGKYFRELSDWIRLCIKCHLKFDKDNKHKL